MSITVRITKAQMLPLAYFEKNYPAYVRFMYTLFSGGKVLFDLRVKVTDSKGFAQNVTSTNVKVLTYKTGPPIPGFPYGPSYILLQTLKAPFVSEDPPTDYHVQAFAKPAFAVAVIVEKAGESVRSEGFNTV